MHTDEVTLSHDPSLPPSAQRLKVLALHAGLSIEEQLAAFEPAERGTRKVIISTNIAEVSYLLCPVSFADERIRLV